MRRGLRLWRAASPNGFTDAFEPNWLNPLICTTNVLRVSRSAYCCAHSFRKRMQLAIAVLRKVAASGSNFPS
ncbi:hypothetical protein [Acidicapsa acidisoli]|uniref:hypothetical protein n=1 Tax=Acidicapsa acidisoli TaxID=1615681 RepID=UPI0021E07663|nr:hypothetical protein [Acidicapsa acidisoli]